MNNKKSLDLEEDQQIETDLVFLLNCYKSREESVHSIREFYGKYSENRNKFPEFDSLQKKISYFIDEFCFHDKVISVTEDEISKKYVSIKGSSPIKRQLLSKFVNNILKINSSFHNKLNHGNYDVEFLKVNEYILMGNLFRDNALSMLKEESFNIYKLIMFIIKTSRSKIQHETKKLKNVFVSNITKSFFEGKISNSNENDEIKKIKYNNNTPIPLKKPKNLKKKNKNETFISKGLMDQPFQIDAFMFLDSVRKKYIVPNALNLPMTSKKNGKLMQISNSLSKTKSNKKQQKNVHIPHEYNILQISEYKPALHLNENPNELITEKFNRIFGELMKANSFVRETLKKYHEDFMKHIEKIKFYEKPIRGLDEENSEKPKSEAKILKNNSKISVKEKGAGNRRSISMKG